MEVFGVPSINPDDFSDNNSSSNDVTGAAITGNIDKIIALLSINNQQNNEMMKVFSTISSNSSSSINTTNTSSIDANTQALIGLTNKIDTASVSYEIKGESGNFFAKLLVASSSEARISRLDKFGMVFSNVVERIGKLGKYSKPIDDLSESLLKFFASSKEIGKGLALAAVGIALFGLSLLTFMEAITFQDLVMFVGIMTAIRIGSEILKGGTWNFAKAAAGIALLGLSIWAFTELITFDMAVDFGKSLVLIGAAMWTFGKISMGVAKQSGTIIAGSFAIASVAGALWIFNKAISDFNDFDLLVAGKTALAAWGAALVFRNIGTNIAPIILGAGAAVAVSAGLYALGYGLKEFASVNLDVDKITNTAIAAGLAIGVLGLIGASGPVAVAIMAGSAAAATVGGALWALSGGLNSMSKVNLTKEQSENFGIAIGYAAMGLSTIGLYALQIGMGVPLALALAGGTVAMAGAIWAIMKLPQIDKTKITDFAEGIQELAGIYGSGSILSSITGGFNSVMYAGIAAVTIAMAGAVRAASWLMPEKTSVTMLTDSLSVFVDGISKAFDEKKYNFSSIKQGIGTFIGIGSMSKDIADTVNEIGNLRFYSKEYRNGKLVITGSRTLNPEDFAKVGQSIGMMLSALTDPLSNIGSAKDTYSIGGYTITNPFSNKVKRGIDAMSNIGKVFGPISNIVNTFSRNGINKPYVTSFNSNLSAILGGIGNAFISNEKQLNRANRMNLNPVISAVKTLTSSASNPLFAANAPKFTKFSGDVLKVKTSLNELNIEKIAKFNIMLQQINEMARNGAMRELVEVFNSFIEKFIDFTDVVKSSANDQNTMSAIPSFGSPLPTVTTPAFGGVQNAAKASPQQQVKPAIDINEIVAAVEKLSTLFRSGQAKVQIKDPLT